MKTAKSKKHNLVAIVVALFSGFAFQEVEARNYFVATHGKNTNPGTWSQPFRSIWKINALDLNPGDKVYIEGGKEFPGSIRLDALDAGSLQQPVVIASYGNGRAVIRPWAGRHGIELLNVGHVEVNKLHLIGHAETRNFDWSSVIDSNSSNSTYSAKPAIANAPAGAGVAVFSDQNSGAFQDILIRDNIIQGFERAGIMIGDGSAKVSYKDVSIEINQISKNRDCGIAIERPHYYLDHFGDRYDSFPNNLHSNIRIIDNAVKDNPGRKNLRAGTGDPYSWSSGNGIYVNACHWAYIKDNVVTFNGQDSEANRAGLYVENTRSARVEFNMLYGHWDNERVYSPVIAGMHVANTVRWINTGQNYISGNNFGVFSGSKYSRFDHNLIFRNRQECLRLYGSYNTWVFNNTFSDDVRFTTQDSMVHIASQRCLFQNNIVEARGGYNGGNNQPQALITFSDLLPNISHTINNNLYYVTHPANQLPMIYNGVSSYTFAQWQVNTGFDSDSLWAEPDLIGTGDTSYGHPRPTSPTVDAGVTVVPLVYDFLGKAISTGDSVDIGAIEYDPNYNIWGSVR